MNNNIYKKFLKDTKDHQMIIKKNDGLYRHLIFKHEDGSSYWFELITWPNALSISGDMGTYVFKRIEDMFDFFSTKDFNESSINDGYWEEKCVASKDDVKTYNSDVFKEAIEYVVAQSFDKGSKDYNECIDQIKEEIYPYIDSGDYIIAMHKLYDFEYPGLYIEYCDFPNIKKYTYRYIWCLYAIVWGIKKFKGEL